MRAFLVVCICFFVLQAGAQLPEKVIGSPIDTASMNVKTPPAAKDDAVVTRDKKPVKMASDTVGPRKHSPTKATLLSMAIPGAGQIYNRKNWWWKVPIIYAGGAALVYGAVYYNQHYQDFKDAYAYTQQYKQPTGDPRFDKYPDDATLRTIRDNYKQARDQCVIGLGLLYTLQVLDAAVEAHFFDFNVNDNLSLNVQPQLGLTGPAYYAGVQFTFKLK